MCAVISNLLISIKLCFHIQVGFEFTVVSGRWFWPTVYFSLTSIFQGARPSSSCWRRSGWAEACWEKSCRPTSSWTASAWGCSTLTSNCQTPFQVAPQQPRAAARLARPAKSRLPRCLSGRLSLLHRHRDVRIGRGARRGEAAQLPGRCDDVVAGYRRDRGDRRVKNKGAVSLLAKERVRVCTAFIN